LPPTVYFMDYNKSQDLSTSLEKIFKNLDIGKKLDKKRVAIKIHMGEEGNMTHIRPAKVRRVVDMVKDAGGVPFVCDTTTLYPYKRFSEKLYLETAARNGFSRETIGCPIIIADGDGYDSVSLPLRKKEGKCHFDRVPMAKGLESADFLLLVSHVKGHMMTGIGGAIKNIGMGCVDKNGKADQHFGSKPFLNEDRCTRCGTCMDVCKYDAISIMDGKMKIDYDSCMYCLSCYFTCPVLRFLIFPDSKST